MHIVIVYCFCIDFSQSQIPIYLYKYLYRPCILLLTEKSTEMHSVPTL